MLKEWALSTYPTSTEYWTFRKKLTQQIALSGFIEFVLHLTRLGPEMINIAKDCGNITFNYYRFDIDDSKGELISRQNCRKSNMVECIFVYMALHFQCRFNKNSLLQRYFLAILLAGIYMYCLLYTSPSPRDS